MHQRATLFLLGALGLAACSIAHTAISPTTTSALVAYPTGTTARTAAPTGDAFDRIAEARCDREARCDKIGNGAYGNQQSCHTDMRSRAKQRLAAVPSFDGVHGEKLDACIAALNLQRCDSALDGLESLLECRTLFAK